ncbi:MAG: hypothetical protein H8E46_09710 [FCB group bacterium]|nr:hypothetical protein [FCB group bacterium]
MNQTATNDPDNAHVPERANRNADDNANYQRLQSAGTLQHVNEEGESPFAPTNGFRFHFDGGADSGGRLGGRMTAHEV